MAMIFQYLEPMVLQFYHAYSDAHGRQTLFQQVPSARPMAETLFRCAIEAGNDSAVVHLLHWQEAGINANDQVCTIDGIKCTAVERSAQLQHLTLTKTLIQMGADVNKSTDIQREIPNWRWGALEWAFHCSDQPVNEKLIALLLSAGGAIYFATSHDTIERIVETQNRSIIMMVANQFIRRMHRSMGAFFYRVFSKLDTKTVLEMTESMYSVGANLNRESWNDELDVFEALIDVAARRGQLQVVRAIRQYGATPTLETLPHAIRSRNIELVKCLLYDAKVHLHHFSVKLGTTPLIEAIRIRNPSLVNYLKVQRRPKLDGDGHCLEASLAFLSELGDLATVKNILGVNSGVERGTLNASLRRSIAAKQTEAAVVLLQAGADTEYYYFDEVKKRDVMESFLLVALRHRDPILVRALLDHGADVWKGDNLEEAIRWGNRSVIEDIVFAGAPFRNSLSLSVKQNNAWCIQKLLSAGADVEGRSPEQSPLKRAAEYNNMGAASELLKHGADPANSDALYEAFLWATEGSQKLFAFLLEQFSRRYPRGKNVFGFDTLDAAILEDRKDLVQALLASKIGIKGYDQHLGEDPLDLPFATAILKDGGTDLEMVRMFLAAGVEVNNVIMEGGCLQAPYCKETPLLVAIRTKACDMVKLLLDIGAVVNRPATNGIKRTPLQQAAEHGSLQVVQLLLDRGADVNAPPAVRGGRTALQLAAAEGYIGIAELLLERGAMPTAPKALINGSDALEGAAEYGRFDMVKFLTRQAEFDSSCYMRATKLAMYNGHHAIADMLHEILTLKDHGIHNEETSTAINISQDEVSDTPEILETTGANSRTASSSKYRHFCRTCNLKVSNTSALRRHERTVHRSNANRLTFTCNTCSQAFSRKDTFDRHVATHDQHNHEPCSSCGKKFRKDYLKGHEQRCYPRSQNEGG